MATREQANLWQERRERESKLANHLLKVAGKLVDKIEGDFKQGARADDFRTPTLTLDEARALLYLGLTRLGGETPRLYGVQMERARALQERLFSVGTRDPKEPHP